MPLQLGKILIFVGALCVIFGLILMFGGKQPYFGKLPGDIYIKKGNFIIAASEPLTWAIITLGLPFI